jgi:hypothetical protein
MPVRLGLNYPAPLPARPPMSTSSFYDLAVKTAKAAEVRSFLAELGELARERDRLLNQFIEQIVASRTRREGKPPKLTRAAKMWIAECDADAKRAATGQGERIAQLSDDALLRLALSDWDTAVIFHNPESYHDNDRAFAVRIDRFNRKARRRVKEFFRRQGLPIPEPSSGGGISFTVAYRPPIPGVGELGADCMAIEPALAALDKLAEKVKVPPLTRFVNPDPDGLSGAKPEWHDPTSGLTTVRALRKELARSPRAVKNGKAVAGDLKMLEDDLIRAEQEGVRCHLVMLD